MNLAPLKWTQRTTPNQSRSDVSYKFYLKLRIRCTGGGRVFPLRNKHRRSLLIVKRWGEINQENKIYWYWLLTNAPQVFVLTATMNGGVGGGSNKRFGSRVLSISTRYAQPPLPITNIEELTGLRIAPIQWFLTLIQYPGTPSEKYGSPQKECQSVFF